MGHLTTSGTVVLGLVLSAQLQGAPDLSRYRDFQLGSTLASVSASTGVAAAEARVIHARPALLQELQWRRGYSVSDTNEAQTDPVQQIVFSFYNDQLTTLVVDYDRGRTAGMTDADMVDALSTVYGAPSKPALKKSRAPMSQIAEESGALVARWGDAGYSIALYRSSYASGFRIIASSIKLEALARTAAAQAIRMDEREAPQREHARQKKEVEDGRVSSAKARLANKAAFRP